MLLFKSSLVAPSINSAYNGTRRRFSSKEVKAFKKGLSEELKNFKVPFDLNSKKLDLNIYVSLPTWLTKDGRIRRNDISNRIKVSEDTFFEALGIEDSSNWRVSATKVCGYPEKFTIFHVSEYAGLGYFEKKMIAGLVDGFETDSK